MSALDHKPQRFLNFEAMIADPNWLHKLGSSITDAQQEELLAAMERIIANEEGNEGPETAIAGRIDDDNLLLHSIVEFNTALYEGAKMKEEKERQARGLDERGLSAPVRDHSVRLLRRPTPKKENPVNSMKSIKYKSGQKPAVMNVSTVEFQKMLARFNMKAKPTASAGRLTLDSQGRSTFAGQDHNQQLSQQELEALQGMDKEQLIAMLLAERGGSRGNTAPASQAAAPASNALLAPLGATPRMGSASGTRLSSNPVPQRAAQLPPLPEGIELNSALEPFTGESKTVSREASATFSAHPSLPVSGALLQNNIADALAKPQSANSLLAPIQIPTSPIKSARGGGSRPPSSLLSLSADAGSDFMIPQSGGISPVGPQAIRVPNKVPTPRAPSGGMSKSASAPLLQTGSICSRTSSRSGNVHGQSQTLGKLSITSNGGNTFSLSKPRLKDIRALRDHLMSTSGSFTLNVNPDSSPDAQTEVMESIAVTKEMVRDTMMKNKVDQIQGLIETPGYYEAVGPADIFKSDVHQNFQNTPAFQNAVKAADVTKGIKRDELRVWSEDGIKNKIQIFAAGGAMKMS